MVGNSYTIPSVDFYDIRNHVMLIDAVGYLMYLLYLVLDTGSVCCWFCFYIFFTLDYVIVLLCGCLLYV